MNQYDSMTFKELVGELAELGTGPVVRFEPIDWDTVAAIESALRKAVIEEASVGVVKLSHNGIASDYDIVPKETP